MVETVNDQTQSYFDSRASMIFQSDMGDKKMKVRGTWQTQSVENVTFDLRVVNLRHTYSVERLLKNKISSGMPG